MAPTSRSHSATGGGRGKPIGRIATPEEVAAAVVFLASAEAVMTSGTVLDINGASYLRM